LRRLDDRPEIRGDEARASDEPAVDVLDREKLLGVAGLHRAPVEDADALRRRDPLGEALADIGVDLCHVVRGRRAARPDRPDGLVGDDEAFGREPVRHGARDLPSDDLERPAGVALGLGLADADDRNESRGVRRFGLRPNHRVGFAVVGTALGMADDDEAAAGVPQHRRRNVAGMGALRLGMAILGAEQHGAAGQHLGDGKEESGGRADEHVATEARPRRAARRDGPVRDLVGEAEPVLPEAVHLPVAGDKLASGQFRLHDPPPLNTRIREMLQAIREQAGSVIVKVLFALLILSFAVWGIGDVFRRGGGETTVAEIGDRKISADQLRQAYNAELDRLRQAFGGAIDASQAKALGLLDQTVEGLVARELLDLEAERLGLALGDDAVRAAIHANPAFHGPDGRFDRRIYSLTLSNLRMSEAEYETQLRGEMLRAQLNEALTVGAQAPKTLAEPLYRMRNERRVAEFAFIPLERAGDVGEPSDQDLAELYERNIDRFRTPEYRGFTALVMTPETVADEIEISEESVRAEYEARQAELEKPERRTIRQILVDTEEKAKAVEAALDSGKSFEETAKEIAGQDPDALALGAVTRNELPPELAETVFSLEPMKPSAAVKTSFGWHIFEVTAVEPGGVPPMETVRDDIRRQILHEKAGDRLYEIANQIEDALAGGATVEEVAATFKLQPVRIAASDPEGRTPEGGAVELPAAAREIVSTAFETPQGQASRVTETKDGNTFFLVQVTEVKPSGTKPREEVTGQLREMWLADKRSQAVEQQAKELADKVGDGKNLAELATESGLETKTSAPFLRNGEGAGELPASLVSAVFDATEGAAVTAAGPGGWYVAQLKSVDRPEPGADAAAVEQLARQLEAQLRGDLAAEYHAGLRSRFPVEIRREEIDRLF